MPSPKGILTFVYEVNGHTPHGFNQVDSDTLMAARSQPNDNWGSVGNGAKHGEKHVGGGSGM